MFLNLLNLVLNQLIRIGNSLLGKTDPKYGREYDLFDELPGLAGFGIKQSDPERSLVYKTTAFTSDLKRVKTYLHLLCLEVVEYHQKIL